MTVSGILDRLEKRGLIVRMPDPTDSRAKIAQLTDEGRQLFDGGRAFAGAMYEQTLQGVTPEQRDAVILALNTMRDNLSGSTAEVEEA
jgi:MarR family transcriptional regulator for hemolysin